MKMRINFNKSAFNSIVKGIKRGIDSSLREASDVLKQAMKDELRDPNKTGVVKRSRRFRASPGRRSAPGESLARDSGRSERLIASQRKGLTKVEVGFKENQSGFDYVEYQEKFKNRPTVEKAFEKSKKKIQDIFNKNLRPR